MKLSEKILRLRKLNGMSQDELAEKLNISRQAVSRWEMGTVFPDTQNILQLSKLFSVTSDYLLNDDESEYAGHTIKTAEITSKTEANRHLAFFALMSINIIILIFQLIAAFILQLSVVSLAGTILSLVVMFGFEWGYRRTQQRMAEEARKYYFSFYITSFWMAAYFPIRLFMHASVILFYPRPYPAALLEVIILLIFVLASAAVTFLLLRKAKRPGSGQ